MLLRNGECKCMVTVFVDCLCCVGPLAVCDDGQIGGIYRTISLVFLVKNTGGNNIDIDDSITKIEWN